MLALGAGFGLVMIGAVVTRVGAKALQRDPTKSTDYRVFVGLALLALGGALVLIGIVAEFITLM